VNRFDPAEPRSHTFDLFQEIQARKSRIDPAS
jgi:hypothetical protein